jgi:hypothetical protein
MKTYIMECLDLGEIKNISELDLRKWAFEVMKNRAGQADDELTEEFNEVIAKGFEKYTSEQAIEIAELYNYEITIKQ